MKGSLKGRYENDRSTAVAVIGGGVGDLKLRASITDASFVNGPSLNGLLLTAEKPGFFTIDYNVPKKDFRFQFMNSIKIAEKPLKLTYIHSRGDNRTILDGSVALDSANKVSANYVLGTSNCKLKYTYMHGGVTSFEPCYDFGKDSWDFAVSRKVYGDDVVRASFRTDSKVLGLDWCTSSNSNASFKISASLNLAEESKIPKLTAESSWNFGM